MNIILSDVFLKKHALNKSICKENAFGFATEKALRRDDTHGGVRNKLHHEASGAVMKTR